MNSLSKRQLRALLSKRRKNFFEGFSKLKEDDKQLLFNQMTFNIETAIRNHCNKIYHSSDLITVSGFFPIKEEVDCIKILISLSKMGYTTALPVTLEKPPSEKPLIFRIFNPELTKLENDVFDIPCPESVSPEVIPDVIITPLLGFDSSKRRIGYGGGFYDRTFKSLERR